MCTLVILRRPSHDWPLLLASNRDEMRNRKWKAPSRHWTNRPETIGGLDQFGGGTWLALNDNGVAAAVLNRKNSLGSISSKRSRGELPLEAVDHLEAEEAASHLSMIQAESYRGFNLVIADTKSAFWLKSSGELNSTVKVFPIPEGVSMITAYDLNDYSCPRIKAHLKKFERLKTPDPGNNDWRDWLKLLKSRDSKAGKNSESTMNHLSAGGYGTVSSSLIGLPNKSRHDLKAKWLFSGGRPDETPYVSINF